MPRLEHLTKGALPNFVEDFVELSHVFESIWDHTQSYELASERPVESLTRRHTQVSRCGSVVKEARNGFRNEFEK